MKAVLFFFLFLVFSVSVYGQNRKIDSLKKVIETTKIDTVKGRACLKLAGAYQYEGDSINTVKYGKISLNIGLQFDHPVLIAEVYNVFGNLYYNHLNFKLSESYFSKSIGLLRQTKNTKLLILVYSNYVSLLFTEGKDKEALGICNEIIRLSIKTNDDLELLIGYMIIGAHYDRQTNYTVALDYYFKANKLAKKLNDKLILSKNYNNIGALYSNMFSYEKAKEYYLMSLNLKKELGHTKEMSSTLLNLGIASANQTEVNGDDYNNEAAYYFKEAIKIKTQFKDQKGILLCYCNLIQFYIKTEQQDSAYKYLMPLREFVKFTNMPEILSSYYILECAYYEKLKNPLKIREFALRAYLSGLENGFYDKVKIALKYAYDSDSALGDWKSAFEHHKLFKQYSDSLNNEEKAKQLGKIESKYEFENQAEAEKRLQQEKAKIEAEAKERRDNLQYLTIFAGIIGLFTGLIFIGKFKIPRRITEIFIFAGLLITFEFFLILFDPYFEKYSGGIPFYKLGFNTLVAFGFAPLHSLLESKLKSRIMKETPLPVPEIPPAESKDEHSKQA